MSGFLDLAIINAHWHREMAKNFGCRDRNAAIRWILKMIEKYGVRFLMGDFNMSAYQILYDLRACGIEAHVVARHVELNEACDKYVHDSCVIVAIGGCMYAPKPCTLDSHCCMAAQLGNGSNGKFGVRGFDISCYIFADVANRPDDHIGDQLVNRVKALRQTAAARRICKACTKEKLCTEHVYEPFNDRVKPPRQDGKTKGDPSFPITKDLPVLPDIKGFQSRPMMWDQMERQLKGVAHWSHFVMVGSTRSRSDLAKQRRGSAYRSSHGANQYNKRWTAGSAPAAAASSQASSSQSAPAAQNGRSNFSPAPRLRSRTTLESRREADQRPQAKAMPRSGVNLVPRGVTSVCDRPRHSSTQKRTAREEREQARKRDPRTSSRR